MDKKTLQIVVPVYNEADCLEEFLRRVGAVKKTLADLDVSTILVDDGSSDDSVEILLRHAENDSSVKVITLSRNYGQQFAVTAGIDHADADYVVLIDSDLQDPPEVIPELVAQARAGYDIVYARRRTRAGENLFKLATARMFYAVIRLMCGVDIPLNTGDFRLISRKVVQVLKSMRERHRFVRGMIPWTGFKACPVVYDRDRRFAGETKFSLTRMMSLALDAIFAFSNIPLRIVSLAGLLLALVGFLGGLFLVYLRLFTEYTVPGITAVIMTIIVMSGIQIIMIGVLGEYLGRTYEQVKARPLYVVDFMKNIG